MPGLSLTACPGVLRGRSLTRRAACSEGIGSRSFCGVVRCRTVLARHTRARLGQKDEGPQDRCLPVWQHGPLSGFRQQA